MLRRASIVAVVLAAAPMAWAQSRVEFSVNGGYTLSDGVTFDETLGFNSIEPNDSVAFGATFGVFVTDNWELEGTWSHQASELIASGPLKDLTIGDIGVDAFHGQIVYNFGEADGPVRPFLSFGMGVTHYGGIDIAGEVSTEGEGKFSTTWGGGVKIYPSKSFGFRLGARWTPTYIKSDEAGYWCDPYWGCYAVGDAQYSNQFEFTGGLTFRF